MCQHMVNTTTQDPAVKQIMLQCNTGLIMSFINGEILHKDTLFFFNILFTFVVKHDVVKTIINTFSFSKGFEKTSVC